MKFFTFFRFPCALCLSILIACTCSFPAMADCPLDMVLRTVQKLITAFDLDEPVKIGTVDLELVQKKLLEALEKQDSVLEFEASLSAPDNRLTCTPFLCKKPNAHWRFLVLYQASPESSVIGYNLSNAEFRKIIENLYNISMYHFAPED